MGEKRREWREREDGRDKKTPSRKLEVGVTAKTFPNIIKNRKHKPYSTSVYRLRRRGIKQYTVAGC